VSDGPFTRRGAGILAAVAAASLAAAGFLGAFGDALYEPPSAAPDSFSRSAVGHRAAVELLRALGWQVLVSRHRTADRAGEGAVVALLEPRVGPEDDLREGILQAIDARSRRLLVVLPKRTAVPDPARPRFAASAELLPLADPQRVLEVLELEAKVVRPERSIQAWRGTLPAPALDRPQLVVSKRLTPLVETDEGMLAGEIESEGVWRTVVLADPDVLATHGLGRGDNAVLLVRLLERLGAGPLPVVVDETLHGLDEQPSLTRALLRFPLVLATASALLAGLLLAWAAAVRFGRPRPPEPALSPGKLFLVESTAALLRHGGHCADAAAAYLRAAKEEVVRRQRPPGDATPGDAWLASAAAARGADAALRDLEDRLRRLAGRRIGAEEESVRAAQAIHRWREELTDGARADPRHDRGAQG
jgi:hypothetical protein